MGALVELFCAVFDLMCQVMERRGRPPGCLAVVVAVGVSGLVCYLVLLLIVALAG